MLNNKIIALYIRLSLEDLDVKRNDTVSESRSISHQRNLLLDFIKKHPEWDGAEIREYKDDGYSGTNFNRPQFVSLMSEVRKGKVAVIIVKDFSRLGRDYLEAGNFLDKIFPAYGVRFIAVNDGYDSNNHIGQTTGMDIGFRNVVNEMYSRDMGAKVKSALMVRYKRGEFLSGMTPYGYIYKAGQKYKFEIDEPAAKIVRRIFDLSIEGYSTYQIAAMFNEKGILSPYDYKRSQGVNIKGNAIGNHSMWTGDRIKKIIKDERYLGHMVSHKTECDSYAGGKSKPVPPSEWIIVKNTHDPIVTQAIFDAANAAMESRRRGDGRKGSLDRSNLFRCPYCGHKLQLSGGSDNKKYLFCHHGVVNNNENCKSIHVLREEVEESVLSTINLLGSLCLEQKAGKIVANSIAVSEHEKKLLSVRSKLSALKNEKRNRYMAFAEGKISKEQYLEKVEDINQKLYKLEAEVEKLESVLINIRKEQEKILQVQHEVTSVFNMEKYDATTLRGVIDAIYVDNESKIELSFCRKDIWEEVSTAS